MPSAGIISDPPHGNAVVTLAIHSQRCQRRSWLCVTYDDCGDDGDPGCMRERPKTRLGLLIVSHLIEDLENASTELVYYLGLEYDFCRYLIYIHRIIL